MYAIIRTGGKQYRVEKDDVLYIEKIAAGQGESMRIDDVLMIGGNDEPRIGTPLVEGAHVSLHVFEHVKDRKVINFVRRRRKSSSKRTKGHRQWLSVVRVEGIYGPGIEHADNEIVASDASGSEKGSGAPNALTFPWRLHSDLAPARKFPGLVAQVREN